MANTITLDCPNRPIAEGDSGAPCLYKVRDGAYQIAAIVFAGRGQGDSVTGYAFPASAAERALGITFGEQLPALGVNEQSGFNLSLYKPSRALRGFSGQALSLESIDEHGASRRLVGPRIPDTGEIVHHWWDISLAASSVSLTIHGGPDTHPQFVGGRTWGFKVLVKRTEDEEWDYVLGGSAELSEAAFTSGKGDDAMTIAVADFTIPLSNKADAWSAYFRSCRRDSTGGDFEVRIEGAPLNRAPIAKAVATPNPVTARSEVTLDGSESTDPDGDALTYAWEQPTEAGGDATSNRVALTGANTAKASFVPRRARRRSRSR